MHILARHRGQFQLALNIDTWNLASLNLSAVEKQAQDSKRQQVLGWLSSFHFQARHELVSSKRAPSTGKWLLESTFFQDFCRHGTTTTPSLWCHGVPGAGKSFISSIVIDHLMSLPKEAEGATMYHYFDYLTAAEQSPTLFCQSLLKQLAKQSDHLPEEVTDLHDRLTKSGQTPKREDLVPILVALVKEHAATFLVIDAIDECHDSFRREVLNIVSQLRSAGVRVFTTSRPHIEAIEDDGAIWKHVKIVAHEEDIMHLFEHLLQQKGSIRKRLSLEFRREIVSGIAEKADSMFLWASLQIAQLLDQRTETAMRRVLQGMHSTLYEVFNDTLKRIGDNDLARRTLLWLSHARRPLTFLALSHALAMDLDYPSTDEVDQGNIPHIDDLVEICGGLVSTDGDNNLRFVHYTVQEYFSAHPESLAPLGHLTIAKTCLLYLSLRVFSGPCHSETNFRRRRRECPLYTYAALEWACHVLEADEPQVEDAVMGIYRDAGLFSSYAQVCCSKTGSPFGRRDRLWLSRFQCGYCPLFDAVRVGMLGLAQRLTTIDSLAAAQAPNEFDPLILAVGTRRWDIVTALVQAGADTSIRSTIRARRADKGCGIGDSDRHGCDRYEDPQLFVFSAWTPVELCVGMESMEGFDLLADYSSIDAMAGSLSIACKKKSEIFASRILQRCHIAALNKSPGFHEAVNQSLTTGCLFDEILARVEEALPALKDTELIFTKLLPTAVRHRPQLIDYLLEKGATANGHERVQWRDGSPLEAAVEVNNMDVARLMLKHGSGVNGLDLSSQVDSCPLHSAVKCRNKAMVVMLLEHGADPDRRALRSITPLMRACDEGYVDIAGVLIGKGANVDAISTRGTALTRALDRGHVGCAKLLLSHGADVNLKVDGPTSLSRAAASGHLEICRLLLSHGAVLNDPTACSPLRVAESIPICELLVDKGADPNMVDASGYSVLDYATETHSEAKVRYLLDHDADLNFCGGHSGSILHAACRSVGDGRVAFILSLGAKLFEKDPKYGGLLQWARLEDVPALLDRGADINARGGKYGQALQGLIARHSYVQREKLLDNVELLIKAGADVNAEGGVYHTALQAACYTGNASVVALLLERGARVDAEGGELGTALQAAAYQGKECVVELLLEAGADVNQCGGVYHTALQAAAFEGNEVVVRLLLERGADTNAQGGKYHNPLRAASLSSRPWAKGVVKRILEEAGAVDTFDSQHDTNGEAAK